MSVVFSKFKKELGVMSASWREQLPGKPSTHIYTIFPVLGIQLYLRFVRQRNCLIRNASRFESCKPRTCSSSLKLWTSYVLGARMFSVRDSPIKTRPAHHNLEPRTVRWEQQQLSHGQKYTSLYFAFLVIFVMMLLPGAMRHD